MKPQQIRAAFAYAVKAMHLDYGLIWRDKDGVLMLNKWADWLLGGSKIPQCPMVTDRFATFYGYMRLHPDEYDKYFNEVFSPKEEL